MSFPFQDHFSGHAADYSRYRPAYPSALFEFLASAAPGRGRAWDCATGNGQAALALAELFDEVVATDASAEQLARAPAHPKVSYRHEPAEAVSLKAESCDLVTVAQALHWLRWEPFFAEVWRTAREGAAVAVWMYNFLRVDERVDALIRELSGGTVGRYWPPERALVDADYAGVPFPFAELTTPAFEMRCDWTAERALLYLSTWSAVRRYREARGEDPVAALAPRLRDAWGATPRTVTWPLVVRVGRV